VCGEDTVKRLLLLLVMTGLIITVPGALFGEDIPVAFLTVENSHFDSRYDYLEGMIEGILLFDLSRAEGISLVERTDLERVLEEQKLQLSGVTAGENAAEIGKILGARYLLKGDYIFLGEDLLINISLLDVETAKSLSFAERGYTENTVHALTEQIVYRLTGKEVSLRSEGGGRSIVSLRDESPGTIALHSPLIDAKIYLDGEFVGYTTGDMREPYIIEDVSPGKHTVRTHLGGGFGVVKLPEVTFHDWEETLEIKPGKRVVVEDETRDFNGTLYRMKQLAYRRFDQPAEENGELRYTESVSFVDRTGRKVEGRLEVVMSPAEGERRVEAVLASGGREERFEIVSVENREVEIDEAVGRIALSLDLTHRYGRFTVTYYLLRNDIEQGMWRKE
jgi:TolB-like protein